MPLEVISERRKYTRLAHTPSESVTLSNRGLRPVVSSNVSAVGLKDGALIVRFHGGATYEYPGSGDKFETMLNSPSKGKFVWRELRRAGVPYNRIGDVVIPDDVEDGSLRDLMREDAEFGIERISTLVTTTDLIELGVIADLERVMILNALLA